MRRGDKRRHSRRRAGELRARHLGEDVEALLEALRALAAGVPAPVPYVQDRVTGDFWPEGDAAGLERGGPAGRGGVRAGLTRTARRRRGACCSPSPLAVPALVGLRPPGQQHDGAHRGLGDGRRFGDAAGHGVTPVHLATRNVPAPGSPWAACPRRSPTPPGTPGCSS